MLKGIEIPSKNGNWLVMATDPNKEPEKKSIGRIFPEAIKPLTQAADDMLKAFYSYRLTFGSTEDIEGGEPVIIPCITYGMMIPNTKFYKRYEMFMEYGVLATVKDNFIIPKLRKAHFGEMTVSSDWPTIQRLGDEDGSDNSTENS